MAEEPTDLTPEDFLPESDQRQRPKPKKGVPLWVVGVFLIVVGGLVSQFHSYFGDVPTNPLSSIRHSTCPVAASSATTTPVPRSETVRVSPMNVPPVA